MSAEHGAGGSVPSQPPGLSINTVVQDRFRSDDGRPKRILTLDGGGVRGMVSLGILKRMEQKLREKTGNEKYVLSDYFDLIAGTSTGAIIAACLARGFSVDEVRIKYEKLGPKVFRKSWTSGIRKLGILWSKHSNKKLTELLKAEFGGIELGGAELKTGLLIVAKRLDTGSTWPMGNNPNGRFFEDDSQGKYVGNRHYMLWQVVRASACAPYYFGPTDMQVLSQEAVKNDGFPSNAKQMHGRFVDGGVSPFNNPAFQAFMYATLQGYNVCWPMGADNLYLVSVGSGMFDRKATNATVPLLHAKGSLLSIMQDCSDLQKILLQWMSSSATGSSAENIDSEVGCLIGDALGLPHNQAPPLLTYKRYDADMTQKALQRLKPLDLAKNMQELYDCGRSAVQAECFEELQPQEAGGILIQ